MNRRSLLFVPATRPERFDKAVATGASAVVIDLEDAVAASDKAGARDAVHTWCSAGHTAIVRVNGADTPWFDDDLELCRRSNVVAVMLPKAERAAHIAAAVRAGATLVLPIVESAAGFAASSEIAAAPGVGALVFGTIDFQADLGMRNAREDDLLTFRCALVLASRLAGIGAPIDGVTTTLDDEARLREDILRARRLGFQGKLCIHPRQVSAVNEMFAVTPDEISWARRVIAQSTSNGGGAVVVDGHMVDRPVLLRAEAILREAGEAPASP